MLSMLIFTFGPTLGKETNDDRSSAVLTDNFHGAINSKSL